MKNSFKIPQLLLRIALGMGFLVTVSDRLGSLAHSEPGILNGATGIASSIIPGH
jgi:hypothetical protein